MHLKDLGNLNNAISIYTNTGSLAGNVNTILTASFKELNAAQILAKISTKKLTDSQKLAIVQEYAVDKANYTTVGSIQTLSAAQTMATGTTTGLTAATKGLGVQLKALATAHPILLAITATIGAIGAGYKIFDLLTVSVKEAKDALEDSKSAFKSVNNELKSVNTHFEQLRKNNG